MKTKNLFIVLATLLSLQLSAQDSWIQFRGNNRNGASSDIRINEIQPDDSIKLEWGKKLGSGFSEMLVFTDRVFTMASEKIDSLHGSEYLLAFDAANGEVQWKTKVDSMVIDPDGSGEGPRSTPAIDGETIYCLSSYGKLRALSLAEGRILWTVDFMKEYGIQPGWIYTSSPMVLGNNLIIEVGASDSRGYAAFDKRTGKPSWIKGSGQPSYCSPVTANIDGSLNLIFANDTTLRSLDQSGNELWSYNMPFQGVTAVPIFIAPNRVFVSSARGCFLIRIEKNQAIEIFSNSSMRNVFSTSCYSNDYLYGISNGALKCISAIDGESTWSKRGFGLGSVTLVGTKLLALTDKGVLKIVEADPADYHEVITYEVLSGKSWTAPAYANGRIYLRNLNEMVSYILTR